MISKFAQKCNPIWGDEEILWCNGSAILFAFRFILHKYFHYDMMETRKMTDMVEKERKGMVLPMANEEMTNEEKRNKIMSILGNYLVEHLEKNRPVTSDFRPCGFRFEVYGTENEGTIQLTYHAPDTLLLRIGVYRTGTDRLYSNFLPCLSTEEMLRYLRDPDTHRDWLERVMGLSKKVDDFWD